MIPPDDFLIALIADLTLDEDDPSVGDDDGEDPDLIEEADPRSGLA